MVSVIQQAIEALEGVIRVADRATVEFDAAKAALASLRAAQEGDLPPPHGFLYDWTHSSATGRTDEEFTGFSCDEDQARRHEAHRNVRPVYTADQLRLALAAAGGGVPKANSIQRRAASLHIKTGMPWDEAEQLALSEAGIDDEAIDELIGECGYSGLESLLTTPDELRRFTRSVLVHQPLASSPQPEAAHQHVRVGPFSIWNTGDQIAIYCDGGEGGEFNAEQFQKAVEAFYAANF